MNLTWGGLWGVIFGALLSQALEPIGYAPATLTWIAAYIGLLFGATKSVARYGWLVVAILATLGLALVDHVNRGRRVVLVALLWFVWARGRLDGNKKRHGRH